MTVLFLICAAVIFSQEGVITELTGTVELKARGQTVFTPAKAGDPVATDTIVSTGFKSTALVRVGSTLLTVRPLTRLSLSEIRSSAGTETINVSLQTGRVRVDVSPPVGTRASMTVTSPMATASVRGTSFEFDTQSLTVLHGSVAFQGANGGVMQVDAGSASEINANGRSADPAAAYAAALLPAPPLGAAGTANRGVSDSTGELVIRLRMK